MAIGSGIKYTCTELPQSREWIRLVNGLVNTALDYEINTLFGAELGPIGKLAKGLDGAFYAKKAIEGYDVAFLAVRSYDRANHRESLFALFNATVKCSGDTLATLKWLGTIGGVVMLKPYAKSFGYVKNVCSVYSASLGVIKGGSVLYTQYYVDASTNPDRNKKMLIATAAIVGSLCSIWLNGMGGLTSYVGNATFVEKGVESLKPWTFNTAILISNVTSIAKQAATAPAA